MSAEGTTAGPSAATQTLDDTTGVRTRATPSSPLHGAIGRNTPWRFSIDAGGPWLNARLGNNGLTTPNHANLAITSDIDIRLDVALDGYREETHLAGRYETTGNQRSWLLSLVPNGLRFIWSPDGTFTNIVTATSAHRTAYSGQRLCLRVTLDVNNGSGGKPSPSTPGSSSPAGGGRSVTTTAGTRACTTPPPRASSSARCPTTAACAHGDACTACRSATGSTECLR
ncbi:hypothetical protein SMICM304S_06783 [Streptomyces microflavus]